MSAGGIWLVSNIYGKRTDEAVMWICHKCGLDAFLSPPYYKHADEVRGAHRCPAHKVHTGDPSTTFKRKPTDRDLVEFARKWREEAELYYPWRLR